MEVFAERLTNREKEVLIGVCRGRCNNTIADDLSISPETVKKHIYNTYKKIRVGNRFQAVLWAVKNLQQNSI